MIIDKLKELRIDPLTKTIVFSNALNFDKALDILRYCKGRVKVSFGIGTNLTCDVGIEGYKPANIVMKMSRCRYSPRDFWEYVIKISDDLGKHMGLKELFDVAVKELHLKELGVNIEG
jgi:nicotinate phosphoribosyltransferase